MYSKVGLSKNFQKVGLLAKNGQKVGLFRTIFLFSNQREFRKENCHMTFWFLIEEFWSVDRCIQAGDAGPILDIMAVMLENISNATVIARTTTQAVFRTAQAIAPLPNVSYQNKARKTANF